MLSVRFAVVQAAAVVRIVATTADAQFSCTVCTTAGITTVTRAAV
jgi:hypothetical protein